MSQFAAYTTPEAVEIKRQFLREPKKEFLRIAGLVPDVVQRRAGRHHRYDEQALKALDDKVNAKAVHAETAATFAERLQLARDYQLTTDAQIGRAMRVSRELVRQWCAGMVYPRDTARLADIMQVPEAWLVHGGEERLPADSPIGVRVGDEAMLFRAILREQTETLLQGMPKGVPTADIQASIEEQVRTDAHLSQLARRAGGRWHFNPMVRHDDVLVFAPWVPIHEHGLSKRFWSDDVEALVADKMASGESIYGIWQELKRECEAKGWQYPTKIALYKRVEKLRERIARFGIDLNDAIAQACAAVA